MENIIIVGGGVIGLSIGWHLAKEGNPCLIIEKGKVGGEASSAAAGMITPVSEVRFGEEKLLQLFMESLTLYPSFIENLVGDTQVVDFQQKGSLMVAIDHDDEAELMRLYDYQKSLGLPVELIDPAEVREKEPLLAPRFAAALEAKSECWIDNWLLIEALKKAYLKAGGILWEEKKVDHLDLTNDRITGVVVEGKRIDAAKVVLATGVHAVGALNPEQGPLWGSTPHLDFPIRPVKGQALEIKMNNGGAYCNTPLQHAIRTIHRYPVYLVPRSDGRIVIGATSEEMGFDQKPKAGAILDLLYGAWKILPNIYEMEWGDSWCGLRPTTPDHAPILGPTPVEGLFMALGMFRHGILLTPIVGKLIAGLVGNGKHSEYFESFGYQRFQLRRGEPMPVRRSLGEGGCSPTEKGRHTGLPLQG